MKMHINKYKDGFGYTYKDGCYYEDAESLIATGILHFCGCGMPNAALEHVRKALQIVDDLKQLVWKKKITYEQWEERKKGVFANNGQEFFMWYFLENKGLTEHGVSVPGWLTQDGIELLSDLNELNVDTNKA